MNFRPDLAAAVMAGTKTVTRRHMSPKPRSPWWVGGCALQVDRTYAVCPGRGKTAIGRVRVTAVDRVRLGYLSDAEARAEGFENEAAFRRAFAQINDGTYDPDDFVWRIAFEPAEGPVA